jgi:hypothetical protein
MVDYCDTDAFKRPLGGLALNQPAIQCMCCTYPDARKRIAVGADLNAKNCFLVADMSAAGVELERMPSGLELALPGLLPSAVGRAHDGRPVRRPDRCTVRGKRDECIAARWRAREADPPSHYESGCGLSCLRDSRGPLLGPGAVRQQCARQKTCRNESEDMHRARDHRRLRGIWWVWAS